MDYQNFIEQLPNLYENWGKESVKPKLQRFQHLLNRVPILTEENLMPLFNFAVSCLDAGEIYCEIGTQQGSTLIAALNEHPDCMAYAVNHFSEFELGEEMAVTLLGTLQELNIQEQVFLCDQTFEEFFFYLRDLKTEDKIGLCFYNSQPDYRSQLLALLLVKPFLATQALLIINNSLCSTSRQAILDFVATHRECQILLELPSGAFDKGIVILSWDSGREENLSWELFNEMRQETAIQAIADLQIVEHLVNQFETLLAEALSLQNQGQFAEAEKKYQEYLLYKNRDAEAWLNLGIIYIQTQKYAESIEALLKSLEIAPENASLYNYLAFVFEKNNNLNQAILAYRQLIELEPTNFEAYNNLGQLLNQLGENEPAEEAYRQAISVNPHHFGSYLNLGNLLIEKNQVDRAIEAYQTALELNPNNPDIVNNLNVALEAKSNPANYLLTWGNEFYQAARYQEAIDRYQKYLELQPGSVDIYLSLSDCYSRLELTKEFLKTVEEGIRLYPKEGRLHFPLIQTLLRNGRNVEAVASAERASRLLPDDYTFKIFSHLIVPIIYNTPDEIDIYRQRFVKELVNLIQETALDTLEARQGALAGTGNVTNFYLAYQAHNVRESQCRYGNLLHKIMEANYPNWMQPISMPPIPPHQKIRIGYLSAYLHSYSGTLWLIGWLRQHDRNNFEIYSYYIGNEPDSITQKFQEYSDFFHHIPGNLEAVCQQVTSDNLHILIFPEIGMNPPTMQIASLRLAPLQCTAWGHPVTTGLSTIDYFLSSVLMEPENAQEHYSESLILLPNIGVAYPKPQDIPPITKTRADFDLREESIIYLCCQAPFKYLPQYDQILAEIALRVPHAQFLFLRGVVLQERLQRAFLAVGLKYEDYCVFRKIPTRSDYLTINLLSDVFLDTFTWSGGNTSLEAIACNLPIVTCPGEFMRGRHADSFLKMMGVTETIAQTEAEYIEIAVRLGLDPDWRQEIAERMRMRHDNLFDDKVCVEALEAFYKQVVQEKLS
ncbi:tetratricopeptide repeat protein [Microcoleus sp. FACHB-672]|uniref:tetratricopeptide repeat protein n=1 Tax=Microcoleus sp. FACHB-672 TaxID=2692825 RepID=UPI0016823D52|nr:glycosyltransferase family 41 protein [Microcoleus sp. FACHB-672]MBD2042245.1 tetratricopeptide repeat protein [Microcoleus sp. FACHB-672]